MLTERTDARTGRATYGFDSITFWMTIVLGNAFIAVLRLSELPLWNKLCVFPIPFLIVFLPSILLTQMFLANGLVHKPQIVPRWRRGAHCVAVIFSLAPFTLLTAFPMSVALRFQEWADYPLFVKYIWLALISATFYSSVAILGVIAFGFIVLWLFTYPVVFSQDSRLSKRQKIILTALHIPSTALLMPIPGLAYSWWTISSWLKTRKTARKGVKYELLQVDPSYRQVVESAIDSLPKSTVDLLSKQKTPIVLAQDLEHYEKLHGETHLIGMERLSSCFIDTNQESKPIVIFCDKASGHSIEELVRTEAERILIERKKK